MVAYSTYTTRLIFTINIIFFEILWVAVTCAILLQEYYLFGYIESCLSRFMNIVSFFVCLECIYKAIDICKI